MKSVKQFFSGLLLCGLALNSLQAQVTFSVGPKAGANFGTVHASGIIGDLAPDFKFMTGVNAGVASEIGFGKYFALQPELNFVQKGFRLQESIPVELFKTDIPVGVELVTRINYIEAPILAKFTLGNEKVQGYAVAGPSFGYATNGTLITRPKLFFELDPIRTDLNLNSLGYEQFEVSGVAGLGVQVNTKLGKFFADARYQHGFTELYNVPFINDKIKNRGISLNAGFLFTFGSTQKSSHAHRAPAPARRHK